MPVRSKLRTIGIVGAGGIVNRNHLPVLLAMDDVKVSWLTDANFARAREVGSSYSVRTIALPRELDQLPPTDLVLLAIPYGARPAFYHALRTAGSALYVEKPLAREAAEHLRICQTFGETRVACGLQRRSWAPALLLKDAIAASLFGPLRRVRYEWGGHGHVPGAGYLSDLRLAGGGILMEQAIHGIDLLLFCAAVSAFEIVQCEMVVDGGLDIHTSANVRLQTETHGWIAGEILATGLTRASNRVEFFFEHAVASFSLSQPDVRVLTRADNTSFTLSPGMVGSPLTSNQAFFAHWREFIGGLETGNSNRSLANDSLLTTTLLEGLYKSAGRVLPAGESF
jgi:predicted dehydrogenase